MSRKIKIALIQQQATKDVNSNTERGVTAYKKAAESGAELIAYAELAFSFFYPQFPAEPNIMYLAEKIPGKTTEIFSDLAKKYKVVTVLNLFEKKGNKTYDSSPVIDTDGSILGITRMVHIIEAPCFHESSYYAPADKHNKMVYNTSIGKIGVAICYDRHFPEYMRGLALQGAELVVIPQANGVNEFQPGVYEAEIQAASFLNGYFVALCNRVGKEDTITFEGKSFVTAPDGRIIKQAKALEDEILYAEIDLDEVGNSNARKYYLKDRRPELYSDWLIR
ncbi:nitrilase-related carbon-nitrogen hydrolase [candidate division KSB1 bacterium]